MQLRDLDIRIINFFRKISIPLARGGLFLIFFWFGFLKIVGLSPAEPLVHELFIKTITFIDFSDFIVLFGIFECMIGIMFLVRGLERVVIPLLLVHMATTMLPLFILPQLTWHGFLVPTMDGQYIIKNLAIIAAALSIVSHLHYLPRHEKTA
jgi:uncharacterized membrane protein YkgB